MSREKALRRERDREREFSHLVQDELARRYEVLWPHRTTQGGGLRLNLVEPPESAIVRFAKDGYRFVAIRIDSRWHTSSTGYGGEDPAFFGPIETWSKICELSRYIEVPGAWWQLNSFPASSASVRELGESVAGTDWRRGESLTGRERELVRQNDLERAHSARLLVELNEVCQAQAQPRLVIDEDGRRTYTEPPEYTTIRFVSDGLSYVAVRVATSWYTTSAVGVWGSWTDSEVINATETWTRICSLASDIELSEAWSSLTDGERGAHATSQAQHQLHADELAEFSLDTPTEIAPGAARSGMRSAAISGGLIAGRTRFSPRDMDVVDEITCTASYRLIEPISELSPSEMAALRIFNIDPDDHLTWYIHWPGCSGDWCKLLAQIGAAGGLPRNKCRDLPGIVWQ
ncbi:UNVERIFIED_CONTAM: hypothetical protein DES50_108200 [Williamsia faeni]